MDNRAIGIFDSGTGGLTVVKELLKQMGNENIVYFGDTAHLPYGSKSEHQILQYVRNDIDFLKQFNLKAVVIACNTADAVARKTVEKEYDFPIYGVVAPASAKALRISANKKIGIIATNACVNSMSYVKEIERFDKNVEVFQMPCPLLVPLVEQGRIGKDDPEVMNILHEYLDPLLEKGIDTLILGCTHYPLMMEAIRKIVGDVYVISSSKALAESLMTEFDEKGMHAQQTNGSRRYFVSDKAADFEDKIRLFMSKDFNDEVIEVRI